MQRKHLTRSGWYHLKQPDGTTVRVEQPMQTAAGIQKGLKTILTERGKFRDAVELRKICNPHHTPIEDRIAGGYNTTSVALLEYYRN